MAELDLGPDRGLQQVVAEGRQSLTWGRVPGTTASQRALVSSSFHQQLLCGWLHKLRLRKASFCRLRRISCMVHKGFAKDTGPVSTVAQRSSANLAACQQQGITIAAKAWNIRIPQPTTQESERATPFITSSYHSYANFAASTAELGVRREVSQLPSLRPCVQSRVDHKFLSHNSNARKSVTGPRSQYLQINKSKQYSISWPLTGREKLPSAAVRQPE